MRRLPLAAFTFAAALALVGCDSSSASSSPAAPQASATAANAVDNFAALNDLSGFKVGKGASSMSMPKAYILFDPQCPHCSHLWDAAKPLQSKVVIKWIPVGLLNGMSGTQAAMLLEAADPVAMMSANEAVFASTNRAPTSTALVKDETRKKVEENTAMLRKLKATAVPTIVYRDPKTNAETVLSGGPSTEKLAEMLGIAAQAPVTGK